MYHDEKPAKICKPMYVDAASLTLIGSAIIDIVKLGNIVIPKIAAAGASVQAAEMIAAVRPTELSRSLLTNFRWSLRLYPIPGRSETKILMK